MAADPAKLIGHVKDAPEVELPFSIPVHMPQPFEALGIPLHMTKFMWIEVVVAVLMVAVFVPLARRIATGQPLKGRLWNMLEVMLLFVRDEIARPAIGKHDADRFLPMLWSMFFFVLFLNLAGMFPWIGSPTAALGTTSALAAVAFSVVVGAGIAKFGAVGYLLGQVPHIEVPWYMAIFLKPMIFVIEVAGLLVKHGILAMRLWANMFAGHLVLAVVLGFIAMAATSSMTWLWYGVTPVSIFGATALSLLELMVAFLQAYVFTFLTALFIGMSVHQH